MMPTILNNDSMVYKNNPNYYSSNPKDHDITEFNNWDEIFILQARKDGANYNMLKDWLRNNFEIPKLKP